MIPHPHHTCSVVVLWGSCPLKNRVIQYTEKQMDYSLDLYTYRVSCMESRADRMDTQNTEGERVPLARTELCPTGQNPEGEPVPLARTELCPTGQNPEGEPVPLARTKLCPTERSDVLVQEDTCSTPPTFVHD
ncbi:hypothetical protein NFI96_022066 [Prochilodus magdalenae]|nr:hypothetical protein NFI96_022066 [Prochilodus magdalenae]